MKILLSILIVTGVYFFLDLLFIPFINTRSIYIESRRRRENAKDEKDLFALIEYMDQNVMKTVNGRQYFIGHSYFFPKFISLYRETLNRLKDSLI